MPISYQFLPWVRRGLAVALDVPDNLGVGAPLAARGSAQVGVKLAAPHDGTAIAPLPMRLHGPGDVIGIDQRLVVRTDPKPHATNFEPNYLAIVDFDPPDFPWMLTPAKAQDDRRLRPWLVLIVLEAKKTGLPRFAPGGLLPSDSHQRLRTSQASCPTLRIPGRGRMRNSSTRTPRRSNPIFRTNRTATSRGWCVRDD